MYVSLAWHFAISSVAFLTLYIIISYISIPTLPLLPPPSPLPLPLHHHHHYHCYHHCHYHDFYHFHHIYIYHHCHLIYTLTLKPLPLNSMSLSWTPTTPPLSSSPLPHLLPPPLPMLHCHLYHCHHSNHNYPSCSLVHHCLHIWPRPSIIDPNSSGDQAKAVSPLPPRNRGKRKSKAPAAAARPSPPQTAPAGNPTPGPTLLQPVLYLLPSLSLNPSPKLKLRSLTPPYPSLILRYLKFKGAKEISI